MYKLIPLTIIQCLLLAGGQVFLKLAMNKLPAFSWSLSFWKALLTNWHFALCGLCFGAASVLWMAILKHFPLSQAYPLGSMTYIFGMLFAIFVFHECVPISRWFGVMLIIVGCYFIMK